MANSSSDNSPNSQNENVNEAPNTRRQLGVLAMTLLVVSAMFGGGVYNIPQNMAQSAALGSILIAWIVTILGIFFLARTFQILAEARPDMTSGIYMYSRAGFGKMVGFLIAWGYWMSVAFGNVSYAVLLMDAVNYFFPPYFAGGNTWQAIVVASIIIWTLRIFVLRGVKTASLINNIGTVAKFVPIILFIFITAYFSFRGHLFGSDFWGNLSNQTLRDKPLGDIFSQIRSTMLVTLWMYIGIEGAVVMSDKATPRTVSRATILGFLIVSVLYVFVSILPFGFMSQGELAGLAPPSTAAILKQIVGTWGEVVINAGIVIALLTSWLVWTLLVAQLPWACAKDGTFPKVFAKTNANGIPSVSLWVSAIIMQLAMVLVYFANDAWNVMLSITGVVILPAYIGSAAYLWKLVWLKQYPEKAIHGARMALVVSVIATFYGLWLVYSAGLQYLLAGTVVYAIGLAIFIWARKEKTPGVPIFTKTELVIAIALVVMALVALLMLFTGKLPLVYTP